MNPARGCAVGLVLGALLWAAVVVVLGLAFPRPAAGDVPVHVSRLPASEFTAIPALRAAPAFQNTAAPGDARTDGWTSWAARSAGITVVGTSQPSPALPQPSTRPHAGRSSTASASPSTEDWTTRPGTISGTASWYRYLPGQAAAGPALRAALGPGWRGTHVTVCTSGHCIDAVLSDFCECYGARVIDLDSRSFAALVPLSQGIVKVEILAP